MQQLKDADLQIEGHALPPIDMPVDYAPLEHHAYVAAHNRMMRANTFDRRRMAKCWVPTTRKRNLAAAKTEDVLRTYVIAFARRNDIALPSLTESAP